MTLLATMKQALEALEYIDNVYMSVPKLGHEAITSLRKAIQEEALRNVQRIGQEIEQEPVAQSLKDAVFTVLEGFTLPNDVRKILETAYYTHPPQRTWVGLTDDEIDQGLLRSDYALKTAEAWRAGVVFAMTQLKEKNT